MGGLRQFCETYERTSVARFNGLMVCYNIEMRQLSDGTFSGTGYKSWEVLSGTDGRDLSPSEQSPIRVTGSVNNSDTITMQYTVQGARRATTGTATFDGGRTVLYSTVGGDSEDFPGTFRSTAANASGAARISAYALRD